MKRTILLLAFGLSTFTSCTAFAGIIASTLTPTQDTNLMSYQNTWQSGFSSHSDVFAVVSGDSLLTLPDVFIDQSVFDAGDDLGILDQSILDTQERYFAISDTKNSDTNDVVNAIWQFDISSGFDMTFSVDLAAMGDFESSDLLSLELLVDSQPWSQLLNFEVDEDASQTYEMSSGQQVVLNDPLGLEGQFLSNRFTTFSWQIPDAETLSVRLAARADGGSEGVMLQNMAITGSRYQVPEPSSSWLMMIGALILLRRHIGFSAA